MTQLSDTQLIVLANASQSLDGNILPLPGSPRGGAQTKVVGSLVKRGLIEERVIDSIQLPDASLNRVWRNEDDGRAILLYITRAGLAAINCEPEDGASEPVTATEGATEGQDADAATDDAARPKTCPRATPWRTPPSRRSGRFAPAPSRRS